MLEQQVRRMLADPRSKALVDNFAGQWLVLRNIRDVAPDPDLFPDFDENLRDAFLRETELFFESQLQRGPQRRRAAERQLHLRQRAPGAALRRCPNVYGDRFRRVTLTDDRRGGLLGQGSLLTVTSYPNRTSPVLRGKWLLETILGTPPPPPPPDVPALQERGEGGKVASVRERLEPHRKNPRARAATRSWIRWASRSRTSTPIGRWRTADAGAPVDASGALPSGAPFRGHGRACGQLLLAAARISSPRTSPKSCWRTRSAAASSTTTCRRCGGSRASAAPHDYRWSSIILGIVNSAPFQMRRSDS